MKVHRIMKGMVHPLCITIFLFLIAIAAPHAWGEPVTTIRDNGDPANRVDLVVLGDGYTAAELTTFAADVETAASGFFGQEPFREYQTFFNVHRVDVVSAESGVDHPEDGTYKDTALDAFYNCGGTERAICASYSKVDAILSANVDPDQRDIILVIVNDSEYGGTGGVMSVVSTHTQTVELVLHEVGHSFGLLADEYDYGDCTTVGIEPSQVNVTIETRRNRIKWNTGGGPPTGWIEDSTAIPTTDPVNGQPGLYEGAKYCPFNVYRPTYNSKMRALYRPFEQINTEQLVKRIYNWVSPLESTGPVAGEVELQESETQLFQAEAMETRTHSLDVEWFVNNQYQSSGPEFIFDAASVANGIYTVTVEVTDPTPWVRYDPANVLMDNRSWTVSVNPDCIADTDGDGTPDCNDDCPDDPQKTSPGICGCGNPDVDSDDDGVLDCEDECPDDPSKIMAGICGCAIADEDSDGDGTPDCNDDCPDDPYKTVPEECGCGTPDTDTDGDDTADCNDECPNDPDKILPGDCGCGVADIDTDADGILNCDDECPDDPQKIEPGLCGCGFTDTDLDGDGILDCFDNCPTDPSKIMPGICGCGLIEIDTDGDETADCIDDCPNDPAKTAPGQCGCGNSELDTDNDGTADCVDIDNDNDGVAETEEQGPDGKNTAYDGNDDTIPDSQQNNVASLHTHDGRDYVTLAAASDASLSDCKAQTNPSAGDAPEDVEFAFGFFKFQIHDLSGAATELNLYLPAGSAPDTYYKFGPTPEDPTDHWYEFLYDGQTGAEINNNVIRLHFVDGLRGDDDLKPNGIIVDIGGPATNASPAVDTANPDPSAPGSGGGGGGGCFIQSLR